MLDEVLKAYNQHDRTFEPEVHQKCPMHCPAVRDDMRYVSSRGSSSPMKAYSLEGHISKSRKRGLQMPNDTSFKRQVHQKCTIHCSRVPQMIILKPLIMSVKRIIKMGLQLATAMFTWFNNEQNIEKQHPINRPDGNDVNGVVNIIPGLE